MRPLTKCEEESRESHEEREEEVEEGFRTQEEEVGS